MTKKEIQLHENFLVVDMFGDAIREFENTPASMFFGKRLRSCTAWVYETSNYYLLKSYDIFICAIEKSTCNVYDALRYVYEYTSTSAYHILTFRHDYNGKKQFTYRPIHEVENDAKN